MATVVTALDEPNDRAHAFGAALTRLEKELREVHRQLDYVEAGLRNALAELVRARFEEYR